MAERGKKKAERGKTVEIDRTLHKKVQLAAIRKDLTFEEANRQALLMWLREYAL